MTWPCCPVCKLDWRVAPQHMEGCPWAVLEKRTEKLERRVVALTELVHTLDGRAKYWDVEGYE